MLVEPRAAGLEGANVMERAANAQLERLVAELTALESECRNAAKVTALFRSNPLPDALLASGAAPAEASYSRNLLHRCETFELLLIRWDGAARSTIHDHGGQNCFMLVCSGALFVSDYDLMSGGRQAGPAAIRYARNTRMCAGEIDVRSSERDLHLVEATDGAATSLHLYARPIDACLAFDANAATCAHQRNVYDDVRAGAFAADT